MKDQNDEFKGEKLKKEGEREITRLMLLAIIIILLIVIIIGIFDS